MLITRNGELSSGLRLCRERTGAVISVVESGSLTDELGAGTAVVTELSEEDSEASGKTVEVSETVDSAVEESAVPDSTVTGSAVPVFVAELWESSELPSELPEDPGLSGVIILSGTVTETDRDGAK